MSKQASLEKSLEIIERLQKIRGIPQFLYYERVYPKQELRVRDAIDDFKSKNAAADEIDVILQSPGGLAESGYRTIRTLRKAFEKVNIVVPFWAKSAATLIALGGSQIIFNEFGEFGPLDSQLLIDDAEKPEVETQSALIGERSLDRIEIRALELYRTMYSSFSTGEERKVKMNRTVLSHQILEFVADFYEPLLCKIDPYDVGARRRSLDVGQEYAERILYTYGKGNKERLDRFVDYLVNECPDHGYVIDYDIVNTFLDNVKKSEEIGVQYDKTLTELSKIFFTGDVENYIGFLKNEGEHAKQRKSKSRFTKKETSK
jgi:hypothetical protein